MANEIRYGVKFDADTSGLARMKSALQQISMLNKSLSKSDVAKAMGVSAQQATSSFAKIKGQIENVEKALKEAFNAKLDTVNIETFNRVLKESGSSMDQVSAALRNAGPAGVAAFNSLSSSVLSTNIQLKQSHTILDKMATTLGNTIKWNAASAAVNGLSRSVEQAWGYVKNLDSSLNDIRIVTGKSADEMADFAKQANDAAKSLGRTTTDYTKAALIYAQQGLSDEQIARRSEITLKTANVTGQSTQAVSEELTAVWNGYKVSAEEAEIYVDRLAAIAATTASDLEELSTGMSKVASAAAAMGVGQEQLAAQLSTIISVTRQAPESVGTALRTVYARISDIKAGIDEDGVTLGNYSGKMAELGFNVLDAAGNLRDMGQVMEEIGGRWQNLTREQQINLAQTMAGQRQYSNLIALFDNFEEYNKALTTAQNAEGTLAQQQSIAMESTAAHLNVLRTSVEDIYDSLIDTKPINNLIDGLSKVAATVATVVDGLGGGIPILTTLGAVGLSVFSQQIAKSINTTIINLQTAKSNALQFSQALEATRAALSNQGLHQTSQELLTAREQMLSLSKVMTPEQFSGIQGMLNSLTDAKNEVIKYEQEISKLSESLKKLGVDNSFEEVMNSNDTREIVNEKIVAYQTLNQDIKEYIKEVQTAQQQQQRPGGQWVKDTIDNLQILQGSEVITTEKFKELQAAHEKALQPNAGQADLLNFWKLFGEALDEAQKKMDPKRFEALSTELSNGKLAQGLQDATRKVRTLSEAFSEAMDRMFNAQKIQNIVDVVGSLGRVSSGIQQIQNLGSIWAKSDISDGEKLVQTLGNLGMALPMITRGLQSLIQHLEWTGIATSTLTGIGIAITAVVSAIGIFNKVLDQNHKKLIKQREASIENQNKIQDQITKQQDLISSIEDLNEKQHSGEITRANLRAEIDNLLKSFDLEDERVKQLKGSYEDTTKAIKQMREESLKKNVDSTTDELEAAEDLFNEKIKDTELDWDKNREFVKDGKYNIAISELEDSGFNNLIEVLKQSQLYVQNNFNDTIGGGQARIGLAVDNSIEGFIQLYDQLTKVRQQARGLIDDGAKLSDSLAIEQIDQWLAAMSQVYNKYTKAIEDHKAAVAQLQAFNLQDQLKNIKSYSDYIKGWHQLTQQLIKSGNYESGEQASQAARQLLQDAYGDVYKKYFLMQDLIKQFYNSSHDIITDQQKAILEDMSVEQLENALSLKNTAVIGSWEDFIKILQQTEEAANGVAAATEEAKKAGEIVPKITPEQMRQQAVDQYKNYTSVEDKVRKGQNISDEQFSLLDAQIQQMFADTADGMHKFIGDAETFYEKINNLKVDGFENAIKFVQDEIDKLSQYQKRQKFDYQTLSQEASRSVKDTNGVAVNLNELMAAQLDYIKTFGNASTQQMGVWEKNLDALMSGQLFGQQLQDFANQLAGAVNNIGIINVEDQLATLNQLLPGLSSQLADASKGPNGLSTDQIRQNAANQYNKYQSLIDATKDGGTISTQLFNSLDEGIQGFFEVAGVGIYKLKDNAQGFEQAVNKISLDSLRKGIEELEAAKNSAEKDFNTGNSLRNQGIFDTQMSGRDLDQYSRDYNLLKKQADFVSKMSPDDDAIQKQVDGWKQVIKAAEEAGHGVRKSILNQMAAGLEDAIAQTSLWGDEQQAKLATMKQELAVLQQMTAEARQAAIEEAKNRNLTEMQDKRNQSGNKYQNLQDAQLQVQGGEPITKQQYDSLSSRAKVAFSINDDLSSYSVKDGMEEIVISEIQKTKQNIYQAFIDQYSGLSQNIKDLYNNQKFDYDQTLDNSGIGINENHQAVMDEENIRLKTEYLQLLNQEGLLVGENKQDMTELLKNATDMLDSHQLDSDILAQINQKYQEAGNQSETLLQLQRQYNKNVKQAAKAQQKINENQGEPFKIDSDVNADQLKKLTKYLMNFAKTSKDINDDLAENAKLAEECAHAILRYDKAVESVTKNYEDWMDQLTNGNIQEHSRTLSELAEAYADLLNMNAEDFSPDFLTEAHNLELMKSAIDGNIDALNQLRLAALDSIKIDLDVQQGTFDEIYGLIEDFILNTDFDNIEVGAEVDDTALVAGLNHMIDSSQVTQATINKILSAIGWKGKWESTQESITLSVPQPVVENPTPVLGFSSGDVGSVGLRYVETPATVETPRLVGFEYVGGGSSGTRPTSGGSSGGGGGRGGGGGKKGGGGKGKKGGGGSKKGKDTEDKKDQKQKKEKHEDQVDIYHDVNKQLNNIERALGRLQKKQDKLWGKQLLDNLNKQSALLEQHKQKLQEKLALQQKDLANKRKDLELLGATFDEYGNISNYIELVSKKQQILNKLIDKYNKLVEKYNKATSEKKKKDLEERMEKFEKQIEAAEKQLDDLEDKVKDYDALQEEMADVQDQIEDDIQQQIQINIKKFRMSIEIRLEMGEAERDWNKFVREVMHHTDVIKDSPFDQIFQDAKQHFDDVMSYFDVHGAGSTLTALADQMYATKDQIEQIDATGWASIYGDNNGTAMQDLQGDLDTLMSQLQDIESLLDDIDQAYLDTIDDVQDNFDKQIDDYEYVADLIEHDIDLLELLYGEKNYNAMNQYYTTLQRNQTNQLDALRKQAEFWQKQWQDAAALGDTEAAKKFEENYRQALDNLNSVIEQAAETIQNKYINAIDNIFDKLDKKISGGLGTDYLDMQWQLMNKNAETYLDTINAAFAIQDLQRKYNKAINETQSIRNQQTLKKLMDEQLDNLREKEKISQYDVDRAEKMLQIEQARIALEDAQSSKTSLRLKRDAQGNYSYQYVSDADKVTEAQEKLAEAQNDLYNFDKQAYKSNLDEMLAAWQEFQDKYKQIVLDTSLTEEERIARLTELRENYATFINDKTAQNLDIRQNLIESAFMNIDKVYQQDVKNYQQMTAQQKEILMGELVPMWNSGIQQMSDKVAGDGGFIPACQDAFDRITEATKNYRDELDAMAQVAGVDLLSVRMGVDDLVFSFENLIMDNDELLGRMFEELTTIQSLRMQAQALMMQYNGVYEAALAAASAIHEFIQAQRAQAAAEAEMAAQAQAQAQQAQAAAASSSGGGTQSDGNSGDYLIQQTKVKSVDGSGTLTIEEKIYPVGGSGGGGGKKGKAAKFDSGGYTGDWDTSDGKFAILHEKELVLNQSDTQNLLNSVQILRDLATNAQLGMSSRLSDVEVFRSAVFNGNKDTIEQNVQITATFPNVNSKQQIEDAFNDLINLAAQRAMRNQ